MFASGGKKSVPFHSNYWENCQPDWGYDAYYRFNKDQLYEGDFFRNCIHGQGTYKWNDVAVYEGGFYANYKEGYAILSFSDNSIFEGLFIRNEPFGPGILTHANGRQDAGFWLGRKLVRLSRAVDFIIPRLAPTPAAKIKLLQFRRLIPLNEKSWDLSTDALKICGYPFEHFYSPYSSLIYDPRSIFFDTQVFEKTYFVNCKEILKEFLAGRRSWDGTVRLSGDFGGEEETESYEERSVPAHCLCQQEFVMEYKNEERADICDEESIEGEYEMGILAYYTKYGTIEGLEKKEEKRESVIGQYLGETDEEEEEGEDGKYKSLPTNIVSWNRTELCTEMLKQIFRYQASEEKLNFNLGKLMLGARTAFRRTGLKEKQCLQFLKMCSIGPGHAVKDLLCMYEISEQLMDARGNNSMMFAAATDQHDVMDILLDYGVDVNTFNDENLTPLNLCLLRRLAHVNGISSWETAFLPKETDTPPTEYPKTQQLEPQESIPSLDRIFGDGMSISDSKSRIFDNMVTSPFTPPTVCRESCDLSPKQQTRNSDESRDLSNLSQITILNIPKSPGTHSLICPTHDEPVLRSPSTFGTRESKEANQPLGSNEETPKINIKFVPKSHKRDEFLKSIKKTNTDKYLFEFTFEKNPNKGERKKMESSEKLSQLKTVRRLKEEEEKEEVEEEETEEGMKVMEEMLDFELAKKIVEIDKTIEKLLRRGADPNLSEVPKPAIHLGVYTKDLKTVCNLLLHGANPNMQLYSNEGLLTPLHTIVLLKPDREYVDICEMLLNFDANPEIETHPEFSISEEEKPYLDCSRGRTPLQLLCMRPDLEYADPEDNLIKMALMLARESDRKRLYNGHTYPTLAMLFGNVKLVKALLLSGLFDPNDVLGKDRGTALHVLVSTELQKKTSLEASIKMCDLLIDAGANPSKKFKHPPALLGTCIDYGYRELDAEREARKLFESARKDSKKTEKSKDTSLAIKDYLRNHETVIEHLMEVSSVKAERTKSGNKKTQNLSKPVQGITGVGEQSTKQKNLPNSAGRENKKEIQGVKSRDGRAKGDEHAGVVEKTTDDVKLNSKNQPDQKKSKKTSKKPLEAAGGQDGVPKRTKKASKPGDEGKTVKERDSKLQKLSGASLKNASTRHFRTPSGRFPEKLRQTLLKMYNCQCLNIDVNEFLVPYVVLRDGQLYYRFRGDTSTQKEQYSLI